MSLVTGVAGVMSDVAAIASGAAEGSNPQASATLGWASLGLGIVGIIKGASGLAVRRGRPFSALMMGGEGERDAVATGQFRRPRHLGFSAVGARGFDFFLRTRAVTGFPDSISRRRKDSSMV